MKTSARPNPGSGGRKDRHDALWGADTIVDDDGLIKIDTVILNGGKTPSPP